MISEPRIDFVKLLCGISSSMSGLSLAVLAFYPESSSDNVRFWLWGAVVLFAITSFRCLDKIMDNICDLEGHNYAVWPKDKPIFDRRIIDFGMALWPFALGWLSFAFGLFHVGEHIGLPMVMNYIGTGSMVLVMISFFIRPF